MAIPRIPSNVSRKIVGGAMVVATAVGGYFVYQRVVLGNPMRLGFDEEGVWTMVTRFAFARAALVFVCPLLSSPFVVFASPIVLH